MSKKGGSSLNASQAASAQTSANTEAALLQGALNRVGQDTPFGTITWAPDPNAPLQTVRHQVGKNDFYTTQEPVSYVAKTTLSPDQQRILDLTEQGQIGLGEIGVGTLGNIGEAISPKLDFGQFGAVPGSAEAGGRNALSDALFARLNPQLDRSRAARENQLANQGITQGSEAWNNAQDDLARAENDARLAATIGADAEQTRALQSRQQQISELLQSRSVPINEITALLSGGQVQMPGAASAPVPQTTVQPTNVSNLYAQEAAMKQQSAGQGSALAGQGLGTLAQLGMMYAMSDEAVKRDIVPIEDALSAINAARPATYRYKDGFGHRADNHAGIIAQSVDGIPGAVVEIDGIKHVDPWPVIAFLVRAVQQLSEARS